MNDHLIAPNSEYVAKNAADANTPLENSDGYTDRLPVNESPIQTPVAENLAPASHFVEGTAQQTPAAYLIKEAPVKEPALAETKPYDIPAYEPGKSSHPVASAPVVSSALLERDETEKLRVRWNEIQGKFVDEPRETVKQADMLVADVIENFTKMFASEQNKLKGQWSKGENLSTEDLRLVLQNYRVFFNRMISKAEL